MISWSELIQSTWFRSEWQLWFQTLTFKKINYWGIKVCWHPIQNWGLFGAEPSSLKCIQRNNWQLSQWLLVTNKAVSDVSLRLWAFVAALESSPVSLFKNHWRELYLGLWLALFRLMDHFLYESSKAETTGFILQITVQLIVWVRKCFQTSLFTNIGFLK